MLIVNVWTSGGANKPYDCSLHLAIYGVCPEGWESGMTFATGVAGGGSRQAKV